SRVTLDLPVGSMRLEQPAIAAALLVLALTGKLRDVRSAPRLLIFAAIAFGIYVAVLAASSALMAPTPAASLRLVLWQAISLAGALAAFLLVRSEPAGSLGWLSFSGAANAVAGIVAAFVFFVAPDLSFGVQGGQSVLPKVFA